jgi:SAM-dependent methyltransferase
MDRVRWERGLSRAVRWLPGGVRRRLRHWYDAVLAEQHVGAAAPVEIDGDYAARAQREREIFAGQEQVHDLPRIFHYWSNTHLRPELERFGFSNPDQFFARFLAEAAQRCAGRPARFISIGSGNCDTEVRVAGLLRGLGVHEFTLECLDLNPAMLARGRELARAAGVDAQVVPVEGDFNHWHAQGRYDAVMANQSLHHVLALEHLFDAIHAGLTDAGSFVVSDMIGRNGHMLWPESRPLVDAYWAGLPDSFRWNCQLARLEERFEDWDCSREGFEGIRAQDILPLLRSRFGFEFFFGFGNLVDPFIGRSFGPHFDPALERDRCLVDRIHARDEAELRAGTIRPAHMLAVLRRAPGTATVHRPFLAPADCERPTASAVLAPDPRARRCPACHAISRIDPVGPLEPTQAGTFHTRDFALVHCRRCDCVRLEPAPTDADLRAMYADAVQFSDDTYSSPERIEAMLRYYGQCLDQLGMMPAAGGASLEVGAGRAWVSRAIKARNPGILTVAQDVTAECATDCPWVDDYVVGAVGDLDRARPFQLISLTHVIEHLVDPQAMLRELAARLAPGGRIFVTAPFRPSGWRAGDGIAKWLDYPYLHVPAHVSYLSRAWFDLAAEAAGLVLAHWDAGHEDGQAFEALLVRPD